MNNQNFFLILTILSLLLLFFFAKDVYGINIAQQETIEQTSPPAPDEDFQKSVQHMLNRAQMTRALAAEHLVYIRNNSKDSTVHQIDEASQVMAYNLICSDEKIDAKTLNQIATGTSFQIAMLTGKSTIGDKLMKVGAQKTVNERMELIGDIATSVLMFEVGRRRGLYDALLTDYGEKRFCDGLRDDTRARYNTLIADFNE